MRLGWLLLAAWTARAAAPDPPGWQVLCKEDFESGSLLSWDRYEVEDGVPWEVRKTDRGSVAAASGHATMILREGPWTDYRMRVRVRLIRGSVQIHYRRSGTKYFLRLERSQLSLVRALPPGVYTPLASLAGDFQFGRWYLLDMVGIGPAVKVYVDETLKFDVQDPDPVLSGGIGFQCMPASEVEIDDLEIIGPPSRTTPAWVRTGGPLGGIGYDIKLRPDNPDIAFATDAFSGVNVSEDGGWNWRQSNEGITTRSGSSGDAIPIFCLTIDPHHSNTIWAGTQNLRGIWKSTDGGKSWTSKERGIVERNGITFRGFTVDPSDSRTVYAAAEISSELWAGRPLLGLNFDLTKGVVYKTEDGGENWRAIWRGDNLARYIWISPEDPRLIYVSTGIFDREAANTDTGRGIPGGVGVLKSVDGGETWQELGAAQGLKYLYIGSLFMQPGSSRVLLAAAGNASYDDGAGVYLSVDAGETWTQRLSGSQIYSVEYSVSNPQIAYAAGPPGLWRSEDGGRTWRMRAGSGITHPAWGPDGVIVGQPIDLQVDPRDPERIFVNNYGGGNFLSEDGGRTWVSASQGYTGANVHDLAVDASDPQRVYAVARSGIFRTRDGGRQWQGMYFQPRNVAEQFPRGAVFAEWYSVATDPAGATLLVGTESAGTLLRSGDGGDSWDIVLRRDFERPLPASKQGFKAVAFAPSNPSVAYAGACHERRHFGLGRADPSFGVFRSSDGGRTWRETNDPVMSTQNVNALAVDPRSEDIVYAGTVTAGLMRSLDGGRSWQAMNRGLPQKDVLAIVLDPSNPFVLYCALSAGGVYKSTDAGATWTSSLVGLNLGSPMMDLAIDPRAPEVLYAADFQAGVFRTEDGGKLWTPLSKGLSTRAVRALALSSDGGTLYAATEGEGVFRLDLKPLER